MSSPRRFSVRYGHRSPFEVIAPGAFDNAVGKDFDFRNEDGTLIGRGTVVDAKVDDDGVTLTYTLPDDIAEQITSTIGGKP